MSVTLRVTLILGSLFFVALVFSTINRKKLQMGDSLLWLLMSLILISILMNALFCSFGVFELSRYVYYNFPCFYLALFLAAFRLVRKKKNL